MDNMKSAQHKSMRRLKRRRGVCKIWCTNFAPPPPPICLHSSQQIAAKSAQHLGIIRAPARQQHCAKKNNLTSPPSRVPPKPCAKPTRARTCSFVIGLLKVVVNPRVNGAKTQVQCSPWNLLDTFLSVRYCYAIVDTCTY